MAFGLTVERTFGSTSEANTPTSRKFFTLAEIHNASTSKSTTISPKSERITPDVKRIDRSKLELLYMLDPIVFNGINSIVKTVLASDFTIEATDAKAKEWLVNLDQHCNTRDLVLKIVQFICMYGPAYIELLNNRAGKPVSLGMIDPKSIDYQKEGADKIKFDEQGRVVGYLQKTPMGKEVKFTREEVVQFKLYTVGDELYPIGLIEPMYRTSKIKLNVEEGLGQAIYRHGFPIFLAKLGDPQHDPSPQQIKDVMEQMKGATHKTELAVPYYWDISILESKRSERLQEHLTYFVNQQIAALGIPKPFVTGTGGDSNRATLLIENRMYERTIKTIYKAVANGFREVFKIVGGIYGWGTLPEFVWNEVDVQNLNSKSERLNRYASSGLLTPSKELEEAIRKLESLPNLTGKEIPREPKDTKKKTGPPSFEPSEFKNPDGTETD